MHRSVVIDNATLVNLTKLKHLQIFQSLRLIFSKIHIPGEVKNEYEKILAKEPERIWLLERLKPNEGFYSLCTRYDSFVLDLLRTVKGIDKGEAEAVAQQKKINAHYILSDDLKFQNAIRKLAPNAKIFTTLHIIAMLDIGKFILNRDELVKALHSIHIFKSSQLRLAYVESCWELGIQLSKKVLNKKCSLKKLGLPSTKCVIKQYYFLSKLSVFCTFRDSFACPISFNFFPTLLPIKSLPVR